MQASFREILEEKLKTPLENTSSTKGKSQFSDPFALSFLIGSIPQFKYQTGQYQNPQFNFSKSKSDNSKPEVEEDFKVNNSTKPKLKTEVLYSVESLTPVGIASIYVLKALGAEVKESFSFSELKKQYRKLLLRHHPDHNNGTASEDFFDLRQAYESISNELGDI